MHQYCRKCQRNRGDINNKGIYKKQSLRHATLETGSSPANHIHQCSKKSRRAARIAGRPTHSYHARCCVGSTYRKCFLALSALLPSRLEEPSKPHPSLPRPCLPDPSSRLPLSCPAHPPPLSHSPFCGPHAQDSGGKLARNRPVAQAASDTVLEDSVTRVPIHTLDCAPPRLE